eukprot:scaffold19539_cov81-Phaeocystis_antarctica.AAC.2
MASGSVSSAGAGLGALANEAAAVGSAVVVAGAAAFHRGFLFPGPLPVLTAASFSASTSSSSSVAAASAAAAACATEAAALASASTVSHLACCRSSCVIAVFFTGRCASPASAITSAVEPLLHCSEASALASSSACTIVV